MADIFISYSRKDIEFVKRLDKALKAVERDVWLDWEDIPPTADWLTEIYTGIEGANTYVFVISPDSLASPVCAKELDHAVKNNKRLVPIVYRSVPSKEVPEVLRRHNFMNFREEDDWDTAFQAFLGAVDLDLEHTRAHTRLLVRAKDWENKQKDSSLLLRGVDLHEAEMWLAQSASGKKPSPIQLHQDYIYASRLVANRRQRIMFGVVSVGFVVAMLLALLAFGQYTVAQAEAYSRATAESVAVAESYSRATAEGVAVAEAQSRATAQAQAEFQANVALSRQLAAQSLTLIDDQADLALLLSLEANDIVDSLGISSAPEVRGSLIDALSFSPKLMLYLRGHSNSVLSVAYSPDGRRIVTGSSDTTLIMWDAATGTPARSLMTGHHSEVYSLDFNRNGNLIASGALDGELRLWNGRTGDAIGGALMSGSQRLNAVAFAKDQDILATAGDGLAFWDVSDPENPVQLGELIQPDEGQITSVAFHPSIDLLTTGYLDGGLTLWDIRDLEHPVALTTLYGHEDEVWGLVFSPNGKLMASGSDDRTIIIWDVSTALQNPDSVQPTIEPLQGHTNFVLDLAFSPDGGVIASASADNSVRLWSTRTGRPISLPLAGHSNFVNALDFSPDGRHLISAGDDGTAIIWDITMFNRLSERIAVHPDGIMSMALNRQGTLMAIGGWDTAIDVVRLDTGELIGEPLTSHSNLVTEVAFSADGTLLASGDLNGQLILWHVNEDENNVEMIGEWDDHEEGITGLNFMPESDEDGRLALATSSYDGTIHFWQIDLDADDPDEVMERVGEIDGGTDGYYGIVFRAGDGDNPLLMASGTGDGLATVWDLSDWPESADLVGELVGHTSTVLSLAFSPDGQTLATGGADEAVRFWDMETMQALGSPVDAHDWFVSTVAFSPDGRMLASGSYDNQVVLWDVATRQRIGQPLTDHSGRVDGVAFTPDGTHLLTASKDGSVLWWDVSFESWRERACAIARRSLTSIEWAQYVGSVPYHATCADWPSAVIVQSDGYNGGVSPTATLPASTPSE